MRLLLQLDERIHHLDWIGSLILYSSAKCAIDASLRLVQERVVHAEAAKRDRKIEEIAPFVNYRLSGSQ